MKGLKKLLNKEQIQAADQHTIINGGIDSIDLMEHAALAFVEALQPYLTKEADIAVCCGIGNNGGDGLAVARILRSMYHNVSVYIIKDDRGSEDYLANLGKVIGYQIFDQDKDFGQHTLIIDAKFGTGLSRPAKGIYADLINKINESNAETWSIDIPSGLYCDSVRIEGAVVKAHQVISFQRPKFIFFMPESDPYIKSWKVIDIGLDECYIQQLESDYFILDHVISQYVRSRRRFSHKGTYGHACILAGSQGKYGAALLSLKACVRSGPGLTTACVEQEKFDLVHSNIPEALCIDRKDVLESLDRYSACGCGPGLGASIKSKELLTELLQSNECPNLILDADALNLISENHELLTFLPKGAILTPHPKEFQRLVGSYNDSEDRLKKQIEFSAKYRVVVVLKDAHTIITDGTGKVYFNISGNAGMATGGSGDVLTGIITGLRAQGYSALESAIIGVYFHGKAGDQISNDRGQYSLIPSDLIETLRINSE